MSTLIRQPTVRSAVPAWRHDPVLTFSPEDFVFEPRRLRRVVHLVLTIASLVALAVSVALFRAVRDGINADEGASPAVGWFFGIGLVVLAAYLSIWFALGWRVRSSRWRSSETGEVLEQRRRRFRGGQQRAAHLAGVFRTEAPSAFPRPPAWFRRGDVIMTTYADRRSQRLWVTLVVRAGRDVHGHGPIARDGTAATRYGAPPDSPQGDAASPVTTT